MAKQTINRGTTANDGTGDSLRDAAGKINENFDELYEFKDTGIAEIIRDTMGTALVEGAGIDITVDDAGNTITIAATGGGGGGSDTFTQAGANAVARTEGAKLLEAPLSPEDFGAAGDGTTNDTVAFQRLAAAINTAGGGTIQFRAGKTYIVGQQTFGTPSGSGTFGTYTGVPATLLDFVDCTKPIIILGNGAKIKCASGLKYGTFDSAGAATSNAMPYTGNQRATPYLYMISATGCSGRIRIENLELDGNIAAQTIGGTWGDTGWQIVMAGLAFYNNTGGIKLRGVKAHHHGQDGIVLDGVAPSDAALTEQVDARGCNFDYNGRCGMVIVAGRGMRFEQCTFNWNATTSATGGTVSSAPASGVDFEAEAGKYVRDISFVQCDFVGSLQQQIVADSATPAERVKFSLCRFVQTNADKYCIWPNRPGFKFEDCLIAGTMVSLWNNAANPHESVKFDRCIFTNSDAYSPTGTLGHVNRLLFDSTAVGIVFRDCLLEHARTGDCSNGSVDGPRFENCTIRNTSTGNIGMYGRFAGRTEFINASSGGFYSLPGPPTGAFYDAGNAEDTWAYTTGGVRTEYNATLDRTVGKKIYFGSATYDPPSLAAAAKTTIQTMTVTGVALGDRVDNVSFSQNLAGARLVAWVSAANTVSYYIINENGANPLDLASGTVRVKVVGA